MSVSLFNTPRKYFNQIHPNNATYYYLDILILCGVLKCELINRPIQFKLNENCIYWIEVDPENRIYDLFNFNSNYSVDEKYDTYEKIKQLKLKLESLVNQPSRINDKNDKNSEDYNKRNQYTHRVFVSNTSAFKEEVNEYINEKLDNLIYYNTYLGICNRIYEINPSIDHYYRLGSPLPEYILNYKTLSTNESLKTKIEIKKSFLYKGPKQGTVKELLKRNIYVVDTIFNIDTEENEIISSKFYIFYNSSDYCVLQVFSKELESKLTIGNSTVYECKGNYYYYYNNIILTNIKQEQQPNSLFCITDTDYEQYKVNPIIPKKETYTEFIAQNNITEFDIGGKNIVISEADKNAIFQNTVTNINENIDDFIDNFINDKEDIVDISDNQNELFIPDLDSKPDKTPFEIARENNQKFKVITSSKRLNDYKLGEKIDTLNLLNNTFANTPENINPTKKSNKETVYKNSTELNPFGGRKQIIGNTNNNFIQAAVGGGGGGRIITPIEEKKDETPENSSDDDDDSDDDDGNNNIY